MSCFHFSERSSPDLSTSLMNRGPCINREHHSYMLPYLNPVKLPHSKLYQTSQTFSLPPKANNVAERPDIASRPWRLLQGSSRVESGYISTLCKYSIERIHWLKVLWLDSAVTPRHSIKCSGSRSAWQYLETLRYCIKMKIQERPQTLNTLSPKDAQKK